LSLAKYCIECGRSLDSDWNVCPDCGTPIYTGTSDDLIQNSTFQTIPHYQQKVPVDQGKRPIEIINEYIWVLYLIAGIVGLLAILTPAGAYQLTYFGVVIESWNMWIYGYNVLYDYMGGNLAFWTDMPIPFYLSIATTLTILIIGSSIIISALRLRKRDIKTSGFILGCGIFLILTAVAYIVIFHIYTLLYSGNSIWNLLTPSFGLIGQFISGILIIIGHIIIRKSHY